MTDLSTTIDTYLDAYGEPDERRRRTLVQEAWAVDGHLVDPPLEGSGQTEIVEVAAQVQAQFPDHRFRRTSGIDEHHSFARYTWALVAPDGAIALTGTDIAELGADGKLRQVVGFLGDLPAVDG